MTETDMRDPRLALLLVFSFALLVITLRERQLRGRQWIQTVRERTPPSVMLLSVFVGVSYVVWLRMFAIYRYTIPMELVAGLLLALAARRCFAWAGHRDALLGMLCLFVLVVTVIPNWGRTGLHGGPYIDVRMPPVPPRSLVLMLSGEPLGYLVPFLVADARVVRPVSNFTGPPHSNRLEQEMANIVMTHDGPLFELRVDGIRDPTGESTLQRFGLRRDDKDCRPIQSNLEPRKLSICQLRRFGVTQ